MTIDLDSTLFTVVIVPMVGVIFGLYGRAIRTENALLQNKIDSLQAQHDENLERLQQGQEAMWNELKCQRDSLAVTREAMLKLDGSINRLNDLLSRMEESLISKVGKQECELIRRKHCDDRTTNNVPLPGGRRATDPPR